jgi:GNAT superfamily N-acetyltransferase
LRDAGPRNLWFRTLGELGYRRQLVTELRLPAPAVDAPQLSDAEMRFLGEADLDAYATLRAASGEATERLARGERCFGIWLDGKLVSTRWLARGAVRLDYIDREEVLAPTDVYYHDVYTAPEYRGRGLSRVAAVVVSELLAAEGARRLVGVLEPENRAAVGANKMAGYRTIGRIGYVKLGPWRRDFGRLD